MTENTAPAETVNLLDADFTAPEPVRVRVDYRVAVQDVQYGDLVADARVGKIRTGPKWTVLETSDEKRIVRLENGTEIPVVRVKETKESREVRQRAQRNLRIQEELATAGDATARALAEVNERIANYGFADYGPMDDLISAQAHDKVLRMVRLMAENARPDWDLVDVYKVAVARFTKTLIATFNNRALSRSTSVVSNLLDDAEAEAMSRFVDRAEWVTY